MTYNIRNAVKMDLPAIVELLASDKLGATREKNMAPLPPSYYEAFEVIEKQDNNHLLVVEEGETIIGTAQLTILTHLTYQGGKCAQIEGVRIGERYRGKGIGKYLFNWMIATAKKENCHLIQLTTDKQRPEALEFYKALGFEDSHIGLKLHLVGVTQGQVLTFMDNQ